jgi:hypothetical protein
MPKGRPSCTRSSQGIVARPVSNLVSIGVPVPSGRGRLRRSGPPRPETGSAGRARQGRCKPRPTDHQLAKPVRGCSLAGRVSNGAGHGHRGIVRECPLGTGHDRCQWHASGTAGEDEPGSGLAAMVAQLRRWARSVPGRPSGSLAGAQSPAECAQGASLWIGVKAADGFSVLLVSLGLRSPPTLPGIGPPAELCDSADVLPELSAPGRMGLDQSGLQVRPPALLIRADTAQANDPERIWMSVTRLKTARSAVRSRPCPSLFKPNPGSPLLSLVC